MCASIKALGGGYLFDQMVQKDKEVSDKVAAMTNCLGKVLELLPVVST
jgi:hypothetical protein